MPAMTVTPSFNEGTGEVSYDFADVQLGSYRNNALDYHNETLDSDFYEDEYGNVHHRYENLDPSVYETFEDDFVPPSSYEDYMEGADISDYDAQSLRDSVGGEAVYASMVAWAAENLAPEWIDRFDNAMEGDYEIMQEAIQWLHNLWQEAGSPFYDEAEAYDEAEEEYFDSDEVAASIMEQVAGSEYEYRFACQWAANNLPSDAVDDYDAMMDVATPAEAAELAAQLMHLYHQNN